MIGDSVLFVGGPLDGQRHDDHYLWPVEVMREHPTLRYSQYAYEIGVPYERAEYQRLLAAGADRTLYALAVFSGWPSGAGT